MRRNNLIKKRMTKKEISEWLSHWLKDEKMEEEEKRIN